MGRHGVEGKVMKRSKACGVCGGTNLVGAIDNAGQPYWGCASCVVAAPSLKARDAADATRRLAALFPLNEAERANGPAYLLNLAAGEIELLRAAVAREARSSDWWALRARAWKREAKVLWPLAQLFCKEFDKMVEQIASGTDRDSLSGLLGESTRMLRELRGKLVAAEKAGEELRWVVKAMLDEFTGVPFANYHRARAALVGWVAVKGEEST